MKNLPFKINNKELSALSLGCMRFGSREDAVNIVKESVKNNITYLDTSPGYCYHSEEENCETWVGEGIKGLREKVILSAKCSSGNGGTGVGEYNPAHGFSIRTADEVRRQIEQSLRRLDVDYFDIYQLWAVHSMEIYEEAFKKGGWLEGVLKAKDEGIVKHIGFTGHITNEELHTAMNAYDWEMYTLPFNVLESTRAEVIEKMIAKNIPVIAMNPLAGGFLSSAGGEIIDNFLKGHLLESLAEMGLRFSNAFGASALCGISAVSQVEQNCAAIEKPTLSKEQVLAMQDDLLKLLNHKSFQCTGCGYCMPCPMEINIPHILRQRNQYKVLGMEGAKNNLLWGEKGNIEKCTKCRLCEGKCPNEVEVTALFEEILRY